MHRRPLGSLPLLVLCLGLALPAAAANDPEASLPYCTLEVGSKAATLVRKDDPSSADATVLKMDAKGDWKKAGTLAPAKKNPAQSITLASGGHYRICFDIGSFKRDMTFALNQAASFTLTGYNIAGKSRTLTVSVETKGQEIFQVKDSTLTLLD
jgi:hypothetical protein